MLYLTRYWLVCMMLAVATQLAAAADTATGAMEQCLGCHDFGPDSPVHEVLGGSHGAAGDGEEMAGRQGCTDCHGPSQAHAGAPTRHSPEVSFGPRWSASSDQQDGQCLGCHEEGKAENWQHSLHMLDNLTCVTCHDIHTAQDKVLDPRQQAEVCTVCHKTQKKGLHGMEKRAARNPPCTDCHNPHNHETAGDEMLANNSAGCSSCHDLVRMAGRASVSAKAKSYHKVMARPGRTCLDCHQGIAHAPEQASDALAPTTVTGRTVTLFYPGMADSDWLLQQHPGSQPLRQGASCQRCHRGEERALGLARDGHIEPSAREIDISFSRVNQELQIVMQWQGDQNDRSVAMMWSDQGSESFASGGCFAACHSDLAGMSKNRGQAVDKYLLASRSQQSAVGQPALIRTPAELQQLRAAGEFARIWQLDLTTGTARQAEILANSPWKPANLISIKSSFTNGTWQVTSRYALQDTGGGWEFDPARKYTFGIALNGADNPGGKHWVSLPMTLGFDSEETDFTAE